MWKYYRHINWNWKKIQITFIYCIKYENLSSQHKLQITQIKFGDGSLLFLLFNLFIIYSAYEIKSELHSIFLSYVLLPVFIFLSHWLSEVALTVYRLVLTTVIRGLTSCTWWLTTELFMTELYTFCPIPLLLVTSLPVSLLHTSWHVLSSVFIVLYSPWSSVTSLSSSAVMFDVCAWSLWCGLGSSGVGEIIWISS